MGVDFGSGFFYAKGMAVRDAHGRFVKTTAETKGAADILSKLVHTRQVDDNEAVVDIKISNPLRKIVQILQDIKNHQATTISMRFTIPLIALPVVILAAFQLGRAQSGCFTGDTSQIGTIQSLTVMAASGDTNFADRLFSLLPGISDQKKLITQKRTVLITGQKETIEVIAAAGVDMGSFEGENVIVTGEYESCRREMTVAAPENVTIVRGR